MEEKNTSTMTFQAAKKIVGNQPRWAVKKMVTALNMCPWLNTEKEKRLLQASEILLKEWPKHFLKGGA